MNRSSKPSSARRNSQLRRLSGRRAQASVQVEPYLAVPRAAHLSAGVLSWTWTASAMNSALKKTVSDGGKAPRKGWRKVSPQLWRSFVNLADGDPRKILAFAGGWGPLRQRLAAAAEPDTESAEVWVHLARLARAILRCSIALGMEQCGATEDWKLICQWLKQFCAPELSKRSPQRYQEQVNMRYRSGVIASALNRWYSVSTGNTLIQWQAGKFVIAPASTSLFGIIGLQLAYRFVQANQMQVCHHCRCFFTPQRPTAGYRRSFCPTCRGSAKPQMYAMRDYRQRLRPEQDPAHLR